MNTYEFKSYEEIKERLRVRLMDTKAHANILQKTVHAPVGCGLALAAYIKLPYEVAEGGIANVPIGMAQIDDVGPERIMEDAKNGSITNAKPRLCAMSNIFFGNKGENLLEKGNAAEDVLYVLTTEDGLLGASTFFYPGIKERIADVMGRDYFVLPSSVHEVLILPDKGQMEPKELLQMVKSINEAEVAPKDRLCDRVFKYHTDTQELTVAADFERKRELER